MHVSWRSINSHQTTFSFVPLAEFTYLVFTHMPGESYRRCLRSLLLYLCYVFQALINSLVCWSCKRALGLVLFELCVLVPYRSWGRLCTTCFSWLWDVCFGEITSVCLCGLGQTFMLVFCQVTGFIQSVKKIGKIFGKLRDILPGLEVLGKIALFSKCLKNLGMSW